MKLSIIFSTYNRLGIFGYTLYSLSKQNFDRKRMELIVVDDNSPEDTLGLLKEHKHRLGCKIQYICYDNQKSVIPCYGHTPALAYNIGFRHATGKTFLIQGNDVIHLHSDNLKRGVELAETGLAVCTNVYGTDDFFVREYMDSGRYKEMDLMELWEASGSKVEKKMQRWWWWYAMFLSREYIFKINGVDEEYLRGVSCEDDDFAVRLINARVGFHRAMDIYCLHLWHFNEGATLPKQNRNSGRWKKGREINLARYEALCKKCKIIANETHEWGSEKTIIRKEIL